MGFLPIVFLEKGPPSSVSFVARKMHAGDSKDHSVVIDLRQDACCSSPFLDGSGLYLSYQFGAREKAREEQKHRRK